MAFSHELKHLLIGLDTGQKVDRTVLILLERMQDYTNDVIEGRKKFGKPYYRLAYMKRFPLNVPTNYQIDQVKMTYDRIEQRYNENLVANQPKIKPYLILDMGNVGQAHFDEYKATGMNVYGINFTSPDSRVTRDGRVWGVPKKDLTSALMVLLENDRLVMPANLPDRKVLTQELAKFTWKQTPSGGFTAENLRDSDHDDTVSALMVAAWYGEFGIREVQPSDLKRKLGL